MSLKSEVGDRTLVTGYVTQAHFLRGHSAEELEKRLGFDEGHLSEGFVVVFLDRVPDTREFEFGGYTQMPDGVLQGHLDEKRDPRTTEQRMEDAGLNVDDLRRRVVNDEFAVAGHRRLAKVYPIRETPREEKAYYPPGSGVPQWRIKGKTPVEGRVAAVVGPGEVYRGEYNISIEGKTVEL